MTALRSSEVTSAGRPRARWPLLAVLGPGLLAGLSDDDPPGITTYSVLGASYGYQLSWVLLASTVALVGFHSLGARMGISTGQGLVGLVRDRFGVRVGGAALLLLLLANLGTLCAELAGVAAGFELFGVSRVVAVPLTAAAVCVLVLKGSFHRVEHVLMALAAVLLAYVVAAVVTRPDWAAAARGLVVPSMPLSSGAVTLVAATVGTTLAPWGLSFIQSYAVDKRLTLDDLRLERVDVVVGSLLTGLIGFCVVVTCAATLHRNGVRIETAGDAADALGPLAGGLAHALFAVGVLGAAVLATAVVPLSTAYSVCEYAGYEARLDDGFTGARLFYVSYLVVMGCAVGAVLWPGLPLVPVLVGTQVLNAVLLLPLLVLLYALARDPGLTDARPLRRGWSVFFVGVILAVAACLVTLLVTSVG